MKITKEYKLKCKQFKKKLVKQVKEFQPYDWGYMFDMIRTCIEYMNWYYNQDCNVWQTEETLNIVKDSLKSCIDIYKELDIVYDNLPQCELKFINDTTTSIEYVNCTEEEYRSAYKEVANKEQELYKKLFDTIRDNFQDWWD